MKKNKTRKISRFVAFACAIALAVPGVYVQAEGSVSDLQNKQSNLQNQLSGINQEITELNDEVTEIGSRIEISEAEIARTEAELQKSKEEEDTQYASMKERIKYMYENGNTTLLELITSAEDMGDFLNKAEFVRNVTDYDRAQLQQLQEVANQIQEQENNLKAEKSSLEELKKESETKTAALQQKAAETSTDLAAAQQQLAAAKQKQAEEEAKAAAAAAAAAASSSQSTSSNPSGGQSSGSSYSGNAGEAETFAALLDCEAISDYDSMLAVATVVMNRVQSGRFPNTIKGVIYASGQYEPVWTGKLDRKLASGASSLARRVAKDAMGGARLSSVSNCYYFLYAPSTKRKGVVIGDNLFFATW